MKKKLLSFEEARNYVHTKNLKNQAEWWIFCKSGKISDNVPRSPDKFYKNNGWNGWYDWFGYDKISVLKNNFIIKANIIHNNKFDYSKVNYINVKNKVIIVCPIHGDFEQTINGHLNGKGCSKCAKIEYRSFENARNFVHSLNLQTTAEWIIFTKSEKIPKDIPHSPNVVYKDNGWVSIGDWLGTNSIALQYMKYRIFEDAKIFAQKQNLKSKNEWKLFTKSEKFPIDVPKTPNRVYKDNGWIGWGDFFGKLPKNKKNVHTLNLKTQKEDFLSFEEAKIFVHKLNLKSQKEWFVYRKSGNKPNNIPSAPCSVYKDKGWVNWGDWLGTNVIANQNKEFLPFEEARKIARNLNLKSVKDWKEYCKNKPDNIPHAPNNTYKDKGWIGWYDWLNTEYLSEEEAKQFLIAKFLDVHPDDMDDVYEKWWNDNRPINLPKNLKSHYKLFYNE